MHPSTASYTYLNNSDVSFIQVKSVSNYFCQFVVNINTANRIPVNGNWNMKSCRTTFVEQCSQFIVDSTAITRGLLKCSSEIYLSGTARNINKEMSLGCKLCKRLSYRKHVSDVAFNIQSTADCWHQSMEVIQEILMFCVQIT